MATSSSVSRMRAVGVGAVIGLALEDFDVGMAFLRLHSGV
jgi:hypothetical protein